MYVMFQLLATIKPFTTPLGQIVMVNHHFYASMDVMNIPAFYSMKNHQVDEILPSEHNTGIPLCAPAFFYYWLPCHLAAALRTRTETVLYKTSATKLEEEIHIVRCGNVR